MRQGEVHHPLHPLPLPLHQEEVLPQDRQEEVLDAVTASDLDPVEMQARVFGVDPDSVSAPVPSAPAAPEAPPAPGTELPSPQWISDTPVGGSWGVRLLATVHDVQPPRAMVALPDGTEIVVQPGQMLPEHHLVVLAVGRDAVQLARITPQGFYARVETETVGSMFPSGAGVE